MKGKIREERYHLAITALGVSCIFLLTLALQQGIFELIRLLSPELLGNYPLMSAMSFGTMYGVAMPVSFLVFQIDRVKPEKKKPMSVLAWFGLFAICFVFSIVGSWIGQGFNTLLHRAGWETENPLDSLLAVLPFWENLLLCGILAPLTEEFFFRKQVIDRLRRYGDLPAVLISGILFGLIHGNFYQFFYAAGIGVVFGLIYVTTGNIRYTVTLHMAINLVGGVYTSEMVQKLGVASLMPGEGVLSFLIGFAMLSAYLLLIGVCVIATPFAWKRLTPEIRLRKATISMTVRDWFLSAVANPCVWVLAGTVVLLFL